MRILFVSLDFPWPADTGGKLRSAAILRALSKDHEITLAAPQYIDDVVINSLIHTFNISNFLPIMSGSVPRIEVSPATSRLRSLITSTTDLVLNRTPYAFRPTPSWNSVVIKNAWIGFDAAFCRSSRAMPLMHGVPFDKIVLDSDDLAFVGLIRKAWSFTHGFGSFQLATEAGRTYFYERGIHHRVAQTLVCSENDRRRLGHDRVSLIPNGVDLPARDIVDSKSSPGLIVWVGSASYEPNTEGLQWFVSRCWPEILQRKPLARFQIVGRDSDARTLPFAVGVDGIELVGPVPTTGPWISGGVLTVAPLLNGMGTRIKIIESLACGRPVVATAIGAEGLEGIEDRHGLFRSTEPKAMVDQVVMLLDDPNRARRLGMAGRELVETHFSWESTTSGLAKAIEKWVYPS